MSIKVVPKSPVFSALVSLLGERAPLDRAKKDATNEFNRHNTKTCKKFAEFLNQENLAAGSIVVIDGVQYCYTTATSRVIDPIKWHDMWQKGEITEKQYFDALAVGKDDAKLIIGEDQVERICVEVRGLKADIRVNADNEGSIKGIQVITPEPIKAPAGIRPRVIDRKPAVQVPARRLVRIAGK
jgi:hypothetical protein